MQQGGTTRGVVVVDAPSNLGLRPPAPGVVPGCYKAGRVLREKGILTGLRTEDAGTVVPPAYKPEWSPGQGSRNAEAIASYSIALADRIASLIDPSRLIVVLGGDCSVLIGEALALRRRGRYGLAFLDGHSDFRHPANSSHINAAAGEDLAIVTGRGDDRLINLESMGPYFEESAIAVAGLRDSDSELAELRALGIPVWTAEKAEAEPGTVGESMIEHLASSDLSGYWVHVDVDILDESVMPAVDSPSKGGLSFESLRVLLEGLLQERRAVGVDFCIYDPDLDPDRVAGSLLAATLNQALRSAVS